MATKKRNDEAERDGEASLLEAFEKLLRSVRNKHDNPVDWLENVEIEVRVIRYTWNMARKTWKVSGPNIPEEDMDELIKCMKSEKEDFEDRDYEFSRDACFKPDPECPPSDWPEGPETEKAQRTRAAFDAIPYPPNYDVLARQTCLFDAKNRTLGTMIHGAKKKLAQLDLRPGLVPVLPNSKRRKLSEEEDSEEDVQNLKTFEGKSVYGVRLCASVDWATEDQDLFWAFWTREPGGHPGSSKKPSLVRLKSRKTFLLRDGSGTRFDLTYCLQSEHGMSGCEALCEKYFENCEKRRKRKKIEHSWNAVGPRVEFEIEFDASKLWHEKLASVPESERVSRMARYMASKVISVLRPHHGLVSCGNELS